MDQHLRQFNSTRLRRGFLNPYPSFRLGKKPFFFIPNTQKDHGSALILAIMFMLIATILITTGVNLINYASKEVQQRELFVSEAENVSRAGLVDALSWFRRQPGAGGDYVVRAYPNSSYTEKVAAPATFATNPATGVSFSYVDQAFNPQNNPNLQLSDTLDSNIGIVNEYPIDSAVTAEALLWGRYEIKKQPVGATDPDAAHDVTSIRSSTGLVSGDGMIWTVVSRGIVYRRFDKQTNPDGTWKYGYATPVPGTTGLAGKVLAQAKFSTEYRKLALNMPTTDINNITAGVYVNSTTQIYLKNNQTYLFGGSVSGTGTYPAISMTK